MKLTLKLYNKHNYYVIYNGDNEVGSGSINNRDVREIIEDNDFTIENINRVENYSLDITIYSVEVK